MDHGRVHPIGVTGETVTSAVACDESTASAKIADGDRSKHQPVGRRGAHARMCPLLWISIGWRTPWGALICGMHGNARTLDGDGRLGLATAEVGAPRQEQPMMSIWSHRPRFLHLGLFFAAYVLGCAFAEALAIVPSSTVSFWPPGGLFIATLLLTPIPSWPWWALAGCLAEMFAQLVWFHSPLSAGFLIYVGNALEAAVGAWLVNRACGRPVRLETLQEVLAFVVLGAGIAPIVSATVGAASLAWFGVKSQTFAAAWPLWWIGDATGILDRSAANTRCRSELAG